MPELGPTPNNSWRTDGDAIDLVREPAPPCPARLAAEPLPVRIDLAATALIVIDMQKFFCEPKPGEDPNAKPGRRPIAPLCNLIPALRAVSVPIVWVNWGNRPDQANLSPGVRYGFNRGRIDNPEPFLTVGSPEAEIVEELGARPDDVHVEKYRLSGFWDSPLDSILRERRIETLLFAGVNLDQCVYHTMADAQFLGYDCILLDDCAATTSPDFCVEATRYNITRCLGFVASSTDVLASLENA